MFVPFKAEHLYQIAAQEAQQYLAPFIEGRDMIHLENKWSHTYVHEGKPLACFGATELWTGRGEVWAYMDKDVGPHLLCITREVRRLMTASDYQRLEAAVAYTFDAGHKWVRLLGFGIEAPRMQRYFINGGDATLYAWVR